MQYIITVSAYQGIIAIMSYVSHIVSTGEVTEVPNPSVCPSESQGTPLTDSVDLAAVDYLVLSNL